MDKAPQPPRVDRSGRQGVLVWLSFAAVAALLAALSLHQIWAADYWWQWKTGQYILEHGIPQTDPFSFTNPDHQRLEVRWVYCVALYKLTTWFGHESAVIVKTIALLLAFGLVGSISFRRAPPVVTAVVVAIAVVASSQRFYVRPEVVTYLLLALMSFLIDRARHRGSRAVYLLPLLQVVWVNTHSLFVLGPVLAGSWLAAEVSERIWPPGDGSSPELRRWRLRTAAILMPLVLAACLVNPYFHRLAILPFVHVTALGGSAMKEFFVELWSPFSFSNLAAGLVAYKVLIGCVVASALINLRRLDRYWALVVLLNFGLSAMAIRNLALFSLVAVPFVVRNVGDSGWLARLSGKRAFAWARPLVAAGLILYCGQAVWSVVTNRHYVERGTAVAFGAGIAPLAFPIEAAKFLRATGVEGPIFNTLLAGSVLVAHDFKVFIDPRGEVYVDRIIDEYRTLVEHPERLPEFVERYGLRVFFVETTEVFLIHELWKSPEWRLVRLDPVAAVFFREGVADAVPAVDPVTDASWLESLYADLEPHRMHRRPGPWSVLSSPIPFLNLGRVCTALGAHEAARRLLLTARAIHPRGFESYEPLAYSSMVTGHDREAAGLYDLALQREPENWQLHGQAARVRLRLGELEEARRHIERFLTMRPEDASALSTLGSIEAHAGRYAQAADALRRATELQPDVVDYQVLLGWALMLDGRPLEALSPLQRALQLDPRRPEALVVMARTALALGRRSEAEGWYDRARTVAPAHPMLEQLRQELGRP